MLNFVLFVRSKLSVDPCFVILVLVKKQARKNLDKILSLKMRKLVSRYANKV